MPGPQRAVVEVGAALGELLAVADTGVGRDDDAGAGEVGPPAQVDVVAVERDRRVEAAERAEQVGAHQQAGRRQHEHVADGVVLLLVELARFDDRVDLAEAVEAEPDVLQHARVVPVDTSLGPTMPAFERYSSSTRMRTASRVGGDVVVAEQEEAVVALDEAQHLVGARPEAGWRSAPRGRRRPGSTRRMRAVVSAIVVDGRRRAGTAC